MPFTLGKSWGFYRTMNTIICLMNLSFCQSQVNDVIYIASVDTLFSAVVEIVPLQLLAYFVAKKNGFDMDKSKNLVKSVTVE